MTTEQVRALCLELGNLIRAAAVWGMDRTSGGATELSEKMVHHFLNESFKAATLREPTDLEIAQVWET